VLPEFPDTKNEEGFGPLAEAGFKLFALFGFDTKNEL
jgi:hypothetical protein